MNFVPTEAGPGLSPGNGKLCKQAATSLDCAGTTWSPRRSRAALRTRAAFLALGHRLSFASWVDSQVPTVELGAIEGLDSASGFIGFGQLNEGEAPRSTSVAIFDQRCFDDGKTVFREQLAELLLIRAEIQVPHEESTAASLSAPSARIALVGATRVHRPFHCSLDLGVAGLVFGCRLRGHLGELGVVQVSTPCGGTCLPARATCGCAFLASLLSFSSLKSVVGLSCHQLAFLGC